MAGPRVLIVDRDLHEAARTLAGQFPQLELAMPEDGRVCAVSTGSR
jgi:hypothetical protein